VPYEVRRLRCGDAVFDFKQASRILLVMRRWTQSVPVALAPLAQQPNTTETLSFGD
jgi:hypothetical protein